MNEYGGRDFDLVVRCSDSALALRNCMIRSVPLVPSISLGKCRHLTDFMELLGWYKCNCGLKG